MSKKDFRNGIVAQAKIDAAKNEKIAKGLKANATLLNGISEHQEQIQNALDVVIDDLADSEASFYGLDPANLPALMDITEKRVLCACVFTLLSSYGQNNDCQRRFYENLENHLGVSERVDSFDFDKLQRIDSRSDCTKILQVICSFLFLNNESFEFLYDKDTYKWLFALAPVTDIAYTCERIDHEYGLFGVEGIVSRYKSDTSSVGEINEPDHVAELDESLQDNQVLSDSYEDLMEIIHNVVDNETSFGKSIELSEADFEREMRRDFPQLAYDSLIATNRIGAGYIIFTTHAFYLKQSILPTSKYVEIPYKSILMDKMHTKAGKKAGTRCLVIMCKTETGVEKRTQIDDSKLVEEHLRDLLLRINSTGCNVAETDKLTELSDLDETIKATILSLVLYILKADDASLTEAFCFADELNIVEKWNDCYSRIADENDYFRIVEECSSDLPYPSKRYLSNKIIKRAMKCLACSNQLKRLPLSQMNSSFERLIKAFDSFGIETDRFNRMMDYATGSFLKEGGYYEQIKKKYKLSNYEEYSSIEQGFDDLIDLCAKNMQMKVLGIVAGGAVGGPAGAVAAGVGGKIIEVVKKKKNDKLDKE